MKIEVGRPEVAATTSEAGSQVDRARRRQRSPSTCPRARCRTTGARRQRYRGAVPSLDRRMRWRARGHRPRTTAPHICAAYSDPRCTRASRVRSTGFASTRVGDVCFPPRGLNRDRHPHPSLVEPFAHEVDGFVGHLAGGLELVSTQVVHLVVASELHPSTGRALANAFDREDQTRLRRRSGRSGHQPGRRRHRVARGRP